MVDSLRLKAYPSTMASKKSRDIARSFAIAGEMAHRAKERRLELGLTVNQVAARMRVTYQRAHGLEREGTVNLRVVLSWANALDMKPERLLFGVDSDGLKA